MSTTRPVVQLAPHAFFWTPLRVLAAATLMQAREDVLRPHGRTSEEATLNQIDACAWIGHVHVDEPDNDNALADFDYVCELLTLDASAVRAAIIREMGAPERVVHARRRHEYLAATQLGR